MRWIVWSGRSSACIWCDIVIYIGIIAGLLFLKPFVIELIEIIDKLIKKKTETGEEESLIQEIVPMMKVDLIEVPLPIHTKPQPSEPESEILDLLSISANTYFS